MEKSSVQNEKPEVEQKGSRKEKEVSWFSLFNFVVC